MAVSLNNSSVGGDYTVHVSLQVLQADVEHRLHQLPPPPRYFIGHTNEFASLKSKAKAGTSVLCIKSIPGAEETSLALKLAAELTTNYPDAQLFLDMNGTSKQPLSSSAAMSQIFHAWHPNQAAPEKDAELRSACFSLLRGKRVLLVLDNAANAEQVEPLLPPDGSLVLVTTHQQFSLPDGFQVNLGPLTTNEARAMLISLAPRAVEQADQIAEACGYLPLALKTFAGIVNDKQLYSVPELLDRLRKKQEKLAPVEAVFQVSYELLSGDTQNKWALLSAFPASFDIQAASAVFSLVNSGDLDSARAGMQDLVNASLVEYNDYDKRFHLHELIRQFCDKKLTQTGRDVVQVILAGYYSSLAIQINHLYDQGGDNELYGLRLFDLERANIEQVFKFSCSLLSSMQLTNTQVFKQRSEINQVAAFFLTEFVSTIAYVGILRFKPTDFIQWQEAGLHAARLIGDKGHEFTALNSLGIVYLHLEDNKKAADYFEQSLLLVREMSDLRGEGKILNNLGNVYKQFDDPLKAINYYTNALSIDQKFDDIDGQREQAIVLGNIGGAYLKMFNVRKSYFMIGANEKAYEFLNQALSLNKKIQDLQGQSRDLGNLGGFYLTCGSLEMATNYFAQALVLSRQIDDKLGESIIQLNYATALDDLGDREQAIIHQETALHILEAIQHPKVGKAREQLSKWREQK